MTANSMFVVLAALAILSPGPSVVFTLTNTLRYGFRFAISGILGIAVGVLLVAGLCSVGLGLLVTSSNDVFVTYKVISIAYLFYFSLRLWKSANHSLTNLNVATNRNGRQFIEGVLLQVTNPYIILFVMIVFPQFIDNKTDHLPEFAKLALTYSVLVILIHGMYAFFVNSALRKFSFKNLSLVVNKSAAMAFMIFGVLLAVTKI